MTGRCDVHGAQVQIALSLSFKHLELDMGFAFSFHCMPRWLSWHPPCALCLRQLVCLLDFCVCVVRGDLQPLVKTNYSKKRDLFRPYALLKPQTSLHVSPVKSCSKC